jgi:hypothetical protein
VGAGEGALDIAPESKRASVSKKLSIGIKSPWNILYNQTLTETFSPADIE